MSDSDESDLQATPQEITDIVEEATLNLLPEKSRKLYNRTYSNFMEWRTKKRISSFSENVLLAYFQELSAKYAPSTLWAEFSMLKSTLNIYEKQDVTQFNKLHAFLKRKSEGYKVKKSKTFTTSELSTFINEAPDEVYLMAKTAVILGIMGACRRQELHRLRYQDVKDLNGTLLINITNTKTKIDRQFTITGKYYHLIKKYMDLRPAASCSNEKNFLKYFNEKCWNQNIGINTFGNMGKTVASYLKVTNPESYTGHCFRRTSATLLVDAGADITALKRHGGWRSTTVAESYIDHSIENKRNVANKIINSIEQQSQVTKPINATSTFIPSRSSPTKQSAQSSAAQSSHAPCSRNQPTHSPTFTPYTPIHNENIFLSQQTCATGEIDLSQVLKQNASSIIITNNQQAYDGHCRRIS